MSVEAISESENRLLGRKEISYVFRGVAGKITREDARKAVSTLVKVDPENVYIAYIRGNHGNRDVRFLSYVYGNKKDAERTLSPYLILRMKPKEERKKIMEEARKAKVKAPKAEQAKKPK